jgi:hypothetical protein
MRAWSGSPFEPVTPLAEVAARGAVISVENGESEVVYECADQPGWLVKLYKPGFPREPIDVLDGLITLPAAMPRADLDLVDSSVCWPVSRVVDGSRTAGVVLAKAPAEFSVPMRMISGAERPHLLDIDQLVQTDREFFARRGWAAPTGDERLAVARGLAAVGALFERHGVVYGDWSYANAFWARGSGRVFVIDVDSSGIGDRPWVESKSWDDPAVAPGTRLTTYTDRYKLAVLVLRCLSGVRGLDFAVAHAALPTEVREGSLGAALWTGLTATDPEERPAIAEILALLESAGTRRSAVRSRPPTPVPSPTPAQPSTPSRPSAPSRRSARVPSGAGPVSSDRLLSLIILVLVVALVLLAAGGLAAALFP